MNAVKTKQRNNLNFPFFKLARKVVIIMNTLNTNIISRRSLIGFSKIYPPTRNPTTNSNKTTIVNFLECISFFTATLQLYKITKYFTLLDYHILS